MSAVLAQQGDKKGAAAVLDGRVSLSSHELMPVRKRFPLYPHPSLQHTHCVPTEYLTGRDGCVCVMGNAYGQSPGYEPSLLQRADLNSGDLGDPLALFDDEDPLGGLGPTLQPVNSPRIHPPVAVGSDAAEKPRSTEVTGATIEALLQRAGGLLAKVKVVCAAAITLDGKALGGEPEPESEPGGVASERQVLCVCECYCEFAVVHMQTEVAGGVLVRASIPVFSTTECHVRATPPAVQICTRPGRECSTESGLVSAGWVVLCGGGWLRCGMLSAASQSWPCAKSPPQAIALPAHWRGRSCTSLLCPRSKPLWPR
jgi:hypothetical protein